MPPTRLQLADRVLILRERHQGLPGERLSARGGVHQQHGIDGGVRHGDGSAVGDDRLGARTSPAAAGILSSASSSSRDSSFPGDRADRVGHAATRHLQHDRRTCADRGRVRHGVLRPALPRLRVDIPRSSTKQPSSTAPADQALLPGRLPLLGVSSSQRSSCSPWSSSTTSPTALLHSGKSNATVQVTLSTSRVSPDVVDLLFTDILLIGPAAPGLHLLQPTDSLRSDLRGHQRLSRTSPELVVPHPTAPASASVIGPPRSRSSAPDRERDDLQPSETAAKRRFRGARPLGRCRWPASARLDGRGCGRRVETGGQLPRGATRQVLLLDRAARCTGPAHAIGIVGRRGCGPARRLAAERAASRNTDAAAVALSTRGRGSGRSSVTVVGEKYVERGRVCTYRSTLRRTDLRNDPSRPPFLAQRDEFCHCSALGHGFIDEYGRLGIDEGGQRNSATPRCSILRATLGDMPPLYAPGRTVLHRLRGCQDELTGRSSRRLDRCADPPLRRPQPPWRCRGS